MVNYPLILKKKLFGLHKETNYSSDVAPKHRHSSEARLNFKNTMMKVEEADKLEYRSFNMKINSRSH